MDEVFAFPWPFIIRTCCLVMIADRPAGSADPDLEHCDPDQKFLQTPLVLIATVGKPSQPRDRRNRRQAASFSFSGK